MFDRRSVGTLFLLISNQCLAEPVSFTTSGIGFSLDPETFTISIDPATFSPPPDPPADVQTLDSQSRTVARRVNIPNTLPIEQEIVIVSRQQVEITNIEVTVPALAGGGPIEFPGLGPLPLITPPTGTLLGIGGENTWSIADIELFSPPAGAARVTGIWSVSGLTESFNGVFEVELSPSPKPTVFSPNLSFTGVEVGNFPNSAQLRGDLSVSYPSGVFSYRFNSPSLALFSGVVDGELVDLRIFDLNLQAHSNGFIQSSLTIVPVPPSLSLLASALSAFVLLGWKNRRKADHVEEMLRFGRGDSSHTRVALALGSGRCGRDALNRCRSDQAAVLAASSLIKLRGRTLSAKCRCAPPLPLVRGLFRTHG